MPGVVAHQPFDRRASEDPITPGAMLIALPLLLYAFIPRPPVGGAQFLAFPVIAGILGILVLYLWSRSGLLSRQVLTVLFLFLVLNICVAVSFFLNVPQLRLGALAELFRPGVFMIFLLYGFYAAGVEEPTEVDAGLLFAAKLVLIGEAVIASTQLLDVPVFDLIYSSEKARPLGSLVRVTGSMGNPNSFGWVVAQAAVITVLLAERPVRWLMLGLFLIFSSGSRTLLLLFPFMIALAGIWRRGGRKQDFLLGGAAAFGGAAGMVILALAASDLLPYLGQLRALVLSGSLESVSSVAKRLLTWTTGYREFTTGGPVVWLFGLGSRQETRVLDNDYLYVLFRLGAIGFAVHLSIMIYAAYHLSRRVDAVSRIGLQYLLFGLVLGIVAETLGGWNHPLLLYFLLGAVLRLGASEDERPNQPRSLALTGAEGK